nr:hypothetical protein HK105_002176 [Polyrhizophydium stewartii]
MLGAAKTALEAAEALSGPFSVLFVAAKAVVVSSSGLKTNRKAAEALGQRAQLLVQTLAERGDQVRTPSARGSLDALEGVLDDLERFLNKTAARSPVHQALMHGKTAERLAEFDAQLTALSQTLQLALTFQGESVASATSKDVADLPGMLQQLADSADTKFEVHRQ